MTNKASLTNVNSQMAGLWSSLVEGDEQLYRPNIGKTCGVC